MNEVIYNRVVDVLAKLLNLAPTKIFPYSTCASLGINSLDYVELLVDMENSFGINISWKDEENLQTVDDLVNLIDQKESTHA
jgi:acyl carrier protein